MTGLVPYQLVNIAVTASTSAGVGLPSEVVIQRPLPAGRHYNVRCPNFLSLKFLH